MTLYFAHGNKLVPPNKNKDNPTLDMITGTLTRYGTKTGNNDSGYWLVISLKTDDDFVNVYFNPDQFDIAMFNRNESLLERTVTLRSIGGMPILNAIDTDSEASVRSGLLKGVTAGTINMEDLPALLEFAKGNVELFAKWQLFQKFIEKEGAEKVREDIEKDIKETQEEFDQFTAKRDHLYDIYKEAMDEMYGMLESLDSALYFLQGEEYLQGTQYMFYGHHSENLVPIIDGYNNLLEAFEKFKTRKGVFVIIGNTIHKIHHAYLDDKGRAYLLGSAKEFRTSKPERIKEIIDELNRIRKSQ
ncbi:MAG: hypothetical protein IKW89_00020 [Bacteroidales bacterium]|nr:hypothetical protein [Bacteroidales bacterium]